MMELSFYNNGHKETYKNPLIDEILEVDLWRALKKMPIFGKTNENVVSFYTCEQFSDIQIPSLF